MHWFFFRTGFITFDLLQKTVIILVIMIYLNDPCFRLNFTCILRVRLRNSVFVMGQFEKSNLEITQRWLILCEMVAVNRQLEKPQGEKYEKYSLPSLKSSTHFLLSFLLNNINMYFQFSPCIILIKCIQWLFYIFSTINCYQN